MKAREEIKTVIGRLSELKNEIQTNKLIVPLMCEAEDADQWNAFLGDQENRDGEVRWFTTVSLHAECYMYRRVKQSFELTGSLRKFDPFFAGKETSFMSSLEACVKIAEKQFQLLRRDDVPQDEIKQQFMELIKLSLYSNKFDMAMTLGISKGATNEEALDYAGRFLDYLSDDSEDIWEYLSQSEDIQVIDVVLDNAGFELFVDLCLADFLYTCIGAKRVRLHAKAMPWFVSNATLRDVNWLIETLSRVGAYSPGLPELGKRWRKYFDCGVWILETSSFWTLPYDFSEMERVDGDLYQSLTDSFLIIFKGDINYRKLLGDINWPFTTSFHSALRGFSPAHIAVLRIVKSDVLCGLTADQEETVLTKGPRWYTHGQYAAIQYD
ncbi:damage-control phosphatase ARMT1-like isoform X2 [Bacillus rossius redtenbacheri]|uniref:damage-control phosphatase ARMT1-like isoform X2 n=1 Tax=Bacillus rossius redtenbacheri TaxID=93214 RepID=UPI002FDEE624